MKDKSKSMLFDHRPDPVLGAALRDALSADDHATFVARVTAALVMPQRVHWNVLASWAPRGIAVACLAALAAALLVTVVEPPMDLMASVTAPSARMVMTHAGSRDPGIMLLPHTGR